MLKQHQHRPAPAHFVCLRAWPVEPHISGAWTLEPPFVEQSWPPVCPPSTRASP